MLQLRFQLCFVLLFIVLQTIHVSTNFVPKGRKCRLQEQHCDIMHPEKQCCAGTSCGVRLINNNLVNICQMCKDIGQPCGNGHTSGPGSGCCKGLHCQKITQYASVCSPIDLKMTQEFDDPELEGKESRSVSSVTRRRNRQRH